ncbi:flavodoxin [Marvinbryantia formatexigens]|nr:flavodoxin [Marvinbryantia formatexigens]SDF65965.1 Flavodoxin [Marvinbryantia formatexigens]
MMKAKKLFAVILTGITAAGLLAGCGSAAGSQTQSTSGTEASTTEEAQSTSGTETSTAEAAQSTSDTEASTTEEAQSGKVLVVYYSATGNTGEVAGYIADAMDGDLFEVEPAEPYTDEDLNWTDDNSRVTREHEDESLRNVELVSTTVEDWDSYDTVFIGYPIWWGIAAWPMDTFVEANDFTGKTVIPFCTSASSGLGESGELLAELAGTGDWLEGERFRSGADEGDVQEWVEGLGL